MWKRKQIAAFLGALLLAACLTAAVDGRARADDDDHELARRALEQGLVHPLAEIVAKVKQSVPGEVIEVELDLENGRYVYELKMISADGRLQELEVDANTAEILDREDED